MSKTHETCLITITITPVWDRARNQTGDLWISGWVLYHWANSLPNGRCRTISSGSISKSILYSAFSFSCSNMQHVVWVSLSRFLRSLRRRRPSCPPGPLRMRRAVSILIQGITQQAPRAPGMRSRPHVACQYFPVEQALLIFIQKNPVLVYVVFTWAFRGDDTIYWLHLGQYYNKKYREGEPREFLPTAAVRIDRTRRVRSIPTAKFGKNSWGISRRYFFILSTLPNLLWC